MATVAVVLDKPLLSEGEEEDEEVRNNETTVFTLNISVFDSFTRQ